MMVAELRDTIIIGGGPGGLSVALGLGRQSRSCWVISHEHFRNDGIKASHAVLGHDHIHPQTILARARKQIDRYGNTAYVEAKIVTVERQSIDRWNNREGFTVVSDDGGRWTGKTLVLATGISDVMPTIDGYRENWPHNIYQCLFCDGWERRSSEKAVLGFPSFRLMEAKMASMALGLDTTSKTDGVARVTMLTNGPLDHVGADPAVLKQVKAVMARGGRLDQRKVTKLEDARPEEGVFVYLQDDEENIERVFFGFLVHKPDTLLNAGHLIERLGVEVTSGQFGKVIKTHALTQATNVPGVFAAGDSGNAMTHVTKAMGSGIGAAGGLVHYLNEMDDEDALNALQEQRPVVDSQGIDGTGCSVKV